MKQQAGYKKILPLTAALAAVGVLGLYAILGVWPFGDGTMLTGDLNGLYVPFYAHFKDALTGDGGLGYSFTQMLGGNLLGLLASYAIGPLHLLYLLVPVSLFGVMAGFVFLLKTVLGCVTMAAYLHRRFPDTGYLAVPLALGYGFCTYVFAYAQNSMWHDILLLLPLICLGVERILKGGRVWLYLLALALAIFANYYVAFMACIFAVLYLVYRLVCLPKDERNLRKTLPRFAAASALAGGVNAALLLPVLANVSASKGVGSSYSLTLETNFTLPAILRQLVWGGYRLEDRETGLPLIYCGMLALVLVLCFFVSRRVPLREKLAGGGLLLVLVLSFWLKDIDTLWHGFAPPVWFPYRYSFMLCFVLVMLAGAALHYRAIGPKQLAIAAGIGAALLGFVFLWPGTVGRRYILVSGALAALVLGGLWLRRKRPRLATTLLTGLVVAELAAGGFIITRTFEAYPNSTYQSFIEDAGGAMQDLQEREDGYYRVEKSFYRTLNDPMLLGYYGISHFSSVVDVSGSKILASLGYRNFGGANTYGYGSTAFADAVLGLRYLASDGERPLPSHYIEVGESGGYTLHRAEFALPLLQMAKGELPTGLEGENAFEYQNRLYTLLSGDEEPLFTQAELAAYDAAGNQTATAGEMPEGSFIYKITAGEPGYYYLWPQAVNSYLHDAELALNGEPHGEYFTALNYGTISLGWLETGETAELAFALDGVARIEWAVAYRMDGAKLAALEQAQTGMEIQAFRDGYVQATVDAGEGGTLLCAIPYDAAWQATAGDEVLQAFELADGFLGIELPPGEVQLVLRYRVPYTGLGWAISGVSLAVCGGWAVYGLLKRKKKQEG